MVGKIGRVEIRGSYGKSGHFSKEVAPVSPVAAGRNVDEYMEDAYRERQEGRSKRRQGKRHFHAIRYLIDELGKEGEVQRLDYLVVEAEMKEIGTELLRQGLEAYLRRLGGAEDEAATIQGMIDRPDFACGREVRAFDGRRLPANLEDLFELNLVLRELPLHEAEGFRVDGPTEALCERVSLSLRPTEAGGILAEASAQVGVMEQDEEGRRTFLYRRAGGSYAFYADKHIDLSI